MFHSNIVWKGIIYASLMAVGKLVCGLWMIRFEPSTLVSPRLEKLGKKLRIPLLCFCWRSQEAKEDSAAPVATHIPAQPSIENPVEANAPSSERMQPSQVADDAIGTPSDQQASQRPKPISLYPASILGTAMMARGEIGFLISAIAESKGIFASLDNDARGPSHIFLIVTWAIVICTFLGPLCVGLLIRRVNRLRKDRAKQGHVIRNDIL
jgi:hypothetical protein